MRALRTSVLMLGVFSLLLGIIYPLTVTVIAGLVWPRQVNGGLVSINGSPVGSLLIGQRFSAPGYFHGRPSECGHDASHSAGLNLGPSNPQLLAQVRARIDSIRSEEGMPDTATVPADLVLASGSGLDPDISPQSALLQVGRVARVRNLEPVMVRSLVLRFTNQPFLGIFGQPRVNVLRLNLALDSMSGGTNVQ
jgi:K+-transporting ATPase ATPase C chain